ncbi:hypothetical protein [Lentzea jiangxiensis]|uniref:Uncharacterized protein n=1 Tax=Lentzea jiangxiensis TaxID=641025 RepID=A0A1H0V5R3_9PSEU|nr:hypothetical protein [Lentzea jiangxiensis]SDP73767.1 hypothetical protein SAMN05421507_113185 [Lentzea jiangxiensis]
MLGRKNRRIVEPERAVEGLWQLLSRTGEAGRRRRTRWRRPTARVRS